MKKIILTLFSAAALSSCDKTANTNETAKNPATTQAYWENVVTAVPDSIDSLKVKPVVLEALKQTPVVKKSSNEETSSYTKSATVLFFMNNQDTAAIAIENNNTFILGDNKGDNKTEEKIQRIYANGKTISIYNDVANITDTIDTRALNRILQKNRVL